MKKQHKQTQTQGSYFIVHTVIRLINLELFSTTDNIANKANGSGSLPKPLVHKHTSISKTIKETHAVPAVTRSTINTIGTPKKKLINMTYRSTRKQLIQNLQLSNSSIHHKNHKVSIFYGFFKPIDKLKLFFVQRSFKIINRHETGLRFIIFNKPRMINESDARLVNVRSERRHIVINHVNVKRIRMDRIINIKLSRSHVNINQPVSRCDIRKLRQIRKITRLRRLMLYNRLEILHKRLVFRYSRAVIRKLIVIKQRYALQLLLKHD
ncbi:hypothetical protein Hanom_Chr13g01241901 [Helianthus anomalus]